MILIATIDNNTNNFPISEAATVVDYIESTIDMNLKKCKLIVDDIFTNELDIIFPTPDVNSKTRYVYIEIDIVAPLFLSNSDDNNIVEVCDYIVKGAKEFKTLTGFKIDRYKHEKHNRRCSFYFNDQSVIPKTLLKDIHNSITIVTL